MATFLNVEDDGLVVARIGCILPEARHAPILAPHG